MSLKEIHIVCTRKLDEKYHIEAKNKRIILHDYDFLNITHLPLNEVEKAIDNLKPEALVFTSQHAVESVKNLNIKNINCYTTDGKTTDLAREYGFSIQGKTQDAESLADLIKSHAIKSVLHASSEDRLDNLENQLKKHEIWYHYVEVYQKHKKSQKVFPFDGIMFYSPSQVETFLELNELPPNSPVFCIGKTTAKYVTEKGHKKVLISEKSQTESILETVYQYFRI